MDKVMNELTDIFRDVLDDENISLNADTTAADVEDWDSLSHITLITEIEKKFKIKFTSSEITGFKNVGELANCVLNKIGG